MNTLSTAEALAVAVLKGDKVAVMALVDLLTHESEGIYTEVPPIGNRIVAEYESLMAVAYIRSGLNGNDTALGVSRINMHDWLSEGGVMMLRHVDRLNVFRRRR